MDIPVLDHLSVVTDHHHDNIQRMRTVYRFSSLMINHRESVAEHVWFVTLYAMLVGELYEQYREPVLKKYVDEQHDFFEGTPDWAPKLPSLDWREMLSRITVHDLDECLSGDFLHSFKYSDPTLLKVIREATESLALGLFRSLVPGGEEDQNRWYMYWMNDKANDVEGRIVGWCDLLSVVSYCVMEIRMGNRNLYPTLQECLGYIREVASLPEPKNVVGWCDFIRAQYDDLLSAVDEAVNHIPKLMLPDSFEHDPREIF